MLSELNQEMDRTPQVRVSQLHNDVAEVLRKAGIPFAMEHLTEDRLFSIDIALTGNSISFLPSRSNPDDAWELLILKPKGQARRPLQHHYSDGGQKTTRNA